jgi:hypothetical protein
MNSSPAKAYAHSAEIVVTFYRESDTATLQRHYTLPPHGCCVLRPSADSELKQFLDEQIGWFTAVTSNPYTTVYYFDRPEHGSVGGDHGF